MGKCWSGMMENRSAASQPPASFEAGTNGIRGFAALLVLYTHLLVPKCEVDPSYAPWAGFMTVDASQGAVLIFFVLSGYVLGLTYRAQPSGHGLIDYAGRRFIRIVPLYLLAAISGVIIHPVDDYHTVVGNLLFLQNDLPMGSWHVQLLKANINLWSLHYEMLYYILFPLVWYTRTQWLKWLCSAAVISVMGWLLPVIGPTIATYAAGWVFWLAGYGLAQAPSVDATNLKSRLPWPSLLLLWLVLWRTKPLWAVCHRLGWLSGHKAWMDFSYFDFLPACIALMMSASGRRPRGSWLIIWTTLAIPIAFLFWRALRGRLLMSDLSLMDGLLVAAVLLWFWRPSPRHFAHLAPIGAISYAIYVFQRPVQWLVFNHIPLPTGSSFSFTVRILATVVITFVVAYLAERKFQPYIRNCWLLWAKPHP